MSVLYIRLPCMLHTCCACIHTCPSTHLDTCLQTGLCFMYIRRILPACTNVSRCPQYARTTSYLYCLLVHMLLLKGRDAPSVVDVREVLNRRLANLLYIVTAYIVMASAYLWHIYNRKSPSCVRACVCACLRVHRRKRACASHFYSTVPSLSFSVFRSCNEWPAWSVNHSRP